MRDGVHHAMAITTRAYTLADLLEIPPGDELYEILGGELVVFSSPDEAHAAAVAGVMRILLAAEDAGFGFARTAPRAVAFDYAQRGFRVTDVTHPDLFFVLTEREQILGERCVEAAPDLIVEILSPSTRALDLPGGGKWAIYERYGVRFYWVVDVAARTLTQYTWRQGHFADPIVLGPGDVLTCPLFPGMEFRLDRVFKSRR